MHGPPRQARGGPQVCLQLLNDIARPVTAAMLPPMSIQTALSVGEPVKNRDTSEPKEFVELMKRVRRRKSEKD